MLSYENGGLRFITNGSITSFLSGNGYSRLSAGISIAELNVRPERSAGATISGQHHGVKGWGGFYAFYSEGGGYGPFTGSHDTFIEKSIELEPGDIVCDLELVNIANVSNAICTAVPSTQAKQRSVRGVFVKKHTAETSSIPAALKGFRGFQRYQDYKQTHDLAVMNALGEGVMNVCGEGGNLETGDYICSSSMRGKGMKQPEQDHEKPYTIAQARHSVSFDSPTQIKQVAVIYLRG